MLEDNFSAKRTYLLFLAQNIIFVVWLGFQVNLHKLIIIMKLGGLQNIAFFINNLLCFIS